MSANTVIQKIEEKANAACAEILKNGEARAADDSYSRRSACGGY